jgi:hypothetical protein
MDWREITYVDLLVLFGFVFLGVIIGYIAWGI